MADATEQVPPSHEAQPKLRLIERLFKLLNMDSTGDLHAKARIRNAAIDCFGREGFGVPIRTIAAGAGVSPGLILHHFGSKSGLRSECDLHVLTTIRAAKLDVIGPRGPEMMLAQLADTRESRPIATYALASLAAGGDLAEHLLEEMTEMTLEFLDAGVGAGSIRPSRVPRERARYLTLTSMGMLLLEYHRLAAAHPGDPGAAFDAATSASVEPALELFTYGLFTDSRYLDAFTETDNPIPEGGDDR